MCAVGAVPCPPGPASGGAPPARYRADCAPRTPKTGPASGEAGPTVIGTARPGSLRSGTGAPRCHLAPLRTPDTPAPLGPAV